MNDPRAEPAETEPYTVEVRLAVGIEATDREDARDYSLLLCKHIQTLLRRHVVSSVEGMGASWLDAEVKDLYEGGRATPPQALRDAVQKATRDSETF